MSICSRCGKQNDDGVKYYSSCGEHIDNIASDSATTTTCSNNVVCPICGSASLYAARRSSASSYSLGVIGFICAIGISYIVCYIDNDIKYITLWEKFVISCSSIILFPLIGVAIGKKNSGGLIKYCMKCGRKWPVNKYFIALY
jgi:hypothetical protein